LPAALYLAKPSDSKVEPLSFHFDGIFGPASFQADIFKEISSFLQSAINGINVCIFAYGQTGSGKTFTMDGPKDDGSKSEQFELKTQSGILPRTAMFLFSEI
jgi:hypothetical protein